KAIDKYASFKSKAAAESNDESTEVDPRLEAIVERLFDKRLDKLEEAITKSDNVQGTLSYCIHVSHSFVNLREYRQEVRGM
ncbi:26S proteasome non-ATPase regulatory subunit 1-like protein, partial [Trifolium pratense]